MTCTIYILTTKKTVIDLEIITIHSDTKIVLFDDAKANFSVEEIDLIKKYGVVKISILGPQISVAYAGNKIFLAAKLFAQLYELKSFSVEEAIQKAYAIHSKAEDYSDIEFIICSADDNVLRIDCIKDGKILNNCPSAWLGSYDAFRKFQRIRIADSAKRPSDITDSAFESVVQGCKDESVGGFYILASYRPDLKSFWYSEKSSFYTEKSQKINTGEDVKFYLNPIDGGFSYHQIPCSFESLIVKIDQMNSLLLYSRVHRIEESKNNNQMLFGLMLPMLVKKDEDGNIVRC